MFLLKWNATNTFSSLLHPGFSTLMQAHLPLAACPWTSPSLGTCRRLPMGDCCATAFPEWENWWTWENCTKIVQVRGSIFASLPSLLPSCCRAASCLSPFSHEYLLMLPQLKHLLYHLPHRGEIILWAFQHPSLPLCCRGNLHHQHWFTQNSSYFVLTIQYNTGCHPTLE